MNSKTSKHLRTIARALPALHDKTGVERTGNDLLAEGIKEDGQGNAIDTEKLYTIYVPKQIDHYEQLKQAYKAGGMEAVNTYCENTKAAFKELFQHRKQKLRYQQQKAAEAKRQQADYI